MVEVNQSQNRPLEHMYPVVYLDAIRIKIRNEANIVFKTMSIALGVWTNGTKEPLGMWRDDTESTFFWLSVSNEFKARGVQDNPIAVTDGMMALF